MVCSKVSALFFAIFFLSLENSVVLFNTKIIERYLKAGKNHELFINLVYHGNSISVQCFCFPLFLLYPVNLVQ